MSLLRCWVCLFVRGARCEVRLPVRPPPRRRRPWRLCTTMPPGRGNDDDDDDDGVENVNWPVPKSTKINSARPGPRTSPCPAPVPGTDSSSQPADMCSVFSVPVVGVQTGWWKGVKSGWARVYCTDRMDMQTSVHMLDAHTPAHTPAHTHREMA